MSALTPVWYKDNQSRVALGKLLIGYFLLVDSWLTAPVTVQATDAGQHVGTIVADYFSAYLHI